MSCRAQHILSASYTIPDSLQLSPECRDLLARVFVLDPAQRLSLAGVRSHPWFVQHLPPGLQVR